MRLKHTRDILEQFGKYVVTQSRSALSKKRKASQANFTNLCNM